MLAAQHVLHGMVRVSLVKDILADTPEAKGRLLIDLINEPDGYTLTWEVWQSHCLMQQT